MALVRMSTLLKRAAEGNYAVGSFSIINIETIIGTIRAAELASSPVIIQIAEPRLKYTPLALIAGAMIKAAVNASVPVAVHLDHGKSREVIEDCIEYGFTSVMIDASDMPLDENIGITKATAAFAHLHHVDCEGEIGVMGIKEDGSCAGNDLLTSVPEAVRFASETEIDAMAVAIGNRHGVHDIAPVLDFGRLSCINKAVHIPLVLHGGSGTTESEFKNCMNNGIRKINVATTTLECVMRAACGYFAEGGDQYFEYHERIIGAVSENVYRHIKIFGSIGKV